MTRRSLLKLFGISWLTPLLHFIPEIPSPEIPTHAVGMDWGFPDDSAPRCLVHPDAIKYIDECLMYSYPRDRTVHAMTTEHVQAFMDELQVDALLDITSGLKEYYATKRA